MNGRGNTKRRKASADRDGSSFIALPHVVVDCAAYRELSWPARALLLELARQVRPGMNGRLLATSRELGPRGFKSHDTIGRALSELQRAGFVYNTCRGGRPARASLYALTWLGLDAPPDLFDHDARRLFTRGAYRQPATENAPLIPIGGAVKADAAPVGGAVVPESAHPCPDRRGSTEHLSDAAAPIGGEHLDIAILPAQRSSPQRE